MKKRPESKAGQVRAANSLLRRLLRTPKTRAGLIAAVTSSSRVSKNYIYGWLSENVRSGVVTKLKATGREPTYVIAEVVDEVAAEGTFPAWLEPRALPLARSRQVVISGSKNKNMKD